MCTLPSLTLFFLVVLFLFFFNDTATTEIYTLSLHDALPISIHSWAARKRSSPGTFALRLTSFHFASKPGDWSLSTRLNRSSTKRATRRYRSEPARQLYAVRMVGTAIVGIFSPLATRLG